GHPLWLPLAHRGPVRAAAFRSDPEAAPGVDGRRVLVTGSEDRTARVWEIADPLDDPAGRVMLALQVANGMTLDPPGVAESVDAAPGLRLRRELGAAGGPPARADLVKGPSGR